jgi:hypothetical protein
MQTIPAEIDEHGNVTLLEKIPLSSKRRAFLTVLDEEETIAETLLLSERALAEDWNRAEEEQAWSHLGQ